MSNEPTLEIESIHASGDFAKGEEAPSVLLRLKPEVSGSEDFQGTITNILEKYIDMGGWSFTRITTTDAAREYYGVELRLVKTFRRLEMNDQTHIPHLSDLLAQAESIIASIPLVSGEWKKALGTIKSAVEGSGLKMEIRSDGINFFKNDRWYACVFVPLVKGMKVGHRHTIVFETVIDAEAFSKRIDEKEALNEKARAKREAESGDGDILARQYTAKRAQRTKRLNKEFNVLMQEIEAWNLI